MTSSSRKRKTASTLQDLTPDERHVLRSVSLLDAFDATLATRAAGLTREGPALRLVERPFVQHDPFALWPFHLHDVVGSTIRTADDPTDDRWSPTNWQHAAQRALTALGEQWTTAAGPRSGRKLLVGCLRLAREHRLEPDWLTEAAWQYISDSVWEPLAPPAGLDTAQATLELAMCFHHAVRGAADCAAASIARLHNLTRDGDYAYYLDIAHFMAGLPHQPHSTVR
ncbi:hypothetical protein AB0M94_37490 [Streptomyces xanthochromogenes]|uniref:hypothetical protein n=1 Tax=Streptomyces xanthochromogenes TaxID=67384 RepID=UPI003438BFF7